MAWETSLNKQLFFRWDYLYWCFSLGIYHLLEKCNTNYSVYYISCQRSTPLSEILVLQNATHHRMLSFIKTDLLALLNILQTLPNSPCSQFTIDCYSKVGLFTVTGYAICIMHFTFSIVFILNFISLCNVVVNLKWNEFMSWSQRFYVE